MLKPNLKLLITGIILIILIAVVLGLKLFIYKPGKQTINCDGEMRNCHKNSDCALVQDGWCKKASAVNIKCKNQWEEKDKIDSQKAEKNHQLCPLLPEEGDKIKNYTLICLNLKCEAKYIK